MVARGLRVLGQAIGGGAALVASLLIAESFLPPAGYSPPREARSALARDPDDPLLVTPERAVPWAVAFDDFDLIAEVELPADGELDLLCRVVQPFQTPSLPVDPFHARFHVLRMSSREEGPFYRTREQALFGEVEGGHLLRGGLPATIRVEGRGRRLRANIAGVWYPWVETLDDHGSFAFVVRGGGPAQITSFEIRAVDRDGDWSLSLAGILGALLGLLCSATAAGTGRALLALVTALPAGALLSGSLLVARTLPDCRPESWSLLLAATAGAPLLLPLLRFGATRVALGLVGVLSLGEGFVRLEFPRMAPFEDPRLTLHFGAESGDAPLDAALGQQHSEAMVHLPRADTRTVILAGGGRLYEPWPRGARRDAAYLGQLLALGLKRELGATIDPVVLATPVAFARQQLELLRRFSFDLFRPEVVVFASDEAEFDSPEAIDPERVHALGVPASPTIWESRLLAALTRSRSIGPPTNAKRLRRILSELVELCGTHSVPLILLEHEGLPDDARRVYREMAQSRGLPLVTGLLGEQPSERLTTNLVRALAQVMR